MSELVPALLGDAGGEVSEEGRMRGSGMSAGVRRTGVPGRGNRTGKGPVSRNHGRQQSREQREGVLQDIQRPACSQPDGGGTFHQNLRSKPRWPLESRSGCGCGKGELRGPRLERIDRFCGSGRATAQDEE